MTTTEARRSRGRPGHDRETVLRRAIDLFNLKGYDATSIGDLTSDLGVTKSALYHHFPSKESLLEAACEEALGGLNRAVTRAAKQEGSAADRLRATVAEAVRVLVAHQPAVTLLLRVRGNSEVEQRALRRRRRLDARLAALVGQAIDEGAIRADLDPAVVSRLVFGTVNSLVDWVDPDGSLDADGLAAAVEGLLFDGLQKPSRPSRVSGTINASGS